MKFAQCHKGSNQRLHGSSLVSEPGGSVLDASVGAAPSHLVPSRERIGINT